MRTRWSDVYTIYFKKKPLVYSLVCMLIRTDVYLYFKNIDRKSVQNQFGWTKSMALKYVCQLNGVDEDK